MIVSQNTQGFTLLEIILVVIIIGIIASFAIPRFNNTIEKTKSYEGIQILETLLNAQRRYYYENNQQYATTLTDLDVTYGTPKNFQTPTVANSASGLASIARTGNIYTLSIDSTGLVSCTDSSSGVQCGRITCTPNCNQ